MNSGYIQLETRYLFLFCGIIILSFFAVSSFYFIEDKMTVFSQSDLLKQNNININNGNDNNNGSTINSTFGLTETLPSEVKKSELENNNETKRPQEITLGLYSSFVNSINKKLLSEEGKKLDKSAIKKNNNDSETLVNDVTNNQSIIGTQNTTASPTSTNSATNTNAISGVSVTSPIQSTAGISLSTTPLKDLVIQNTSMSKPAPVRHPGQPPHEVVFALPLREDGKVWSGTVTFTASKPIEVEVLHTYSPVDIPDSSHGEPYHAVLPGNNSIAITHLRQLVDIPFEINGTGISSGSLDFVGNALVFHKTTGEPFTVTYTMDVRVKEITDNKNNINEQR